MSEHFTRNTVSAQKYCGKCGKVTDHRIDDRRFGPCLACIARLDALAAEPKRPEAEKQEELFA